LIDAAPPPAFASVLNRYADVNDIAMVALGEYRSELPAGRQSEYLAKTESHISRFLAEHVPSRVASNLAIQTCNGDLVGISRQSFEYHVAPVGRTYSRRESNGVRIALELRSKFMDVLRRNNAGVSALFDFLSS